MINALRKALPKGQEELAQLVRTLWRRREDILAFFDVGASNGPVEAINRCLEHLRWGRSGVQESGPLHLEVTDSLGAAAGPDQRPLKHEEPAKLYPFDPGRQPMNIQRKSHESNRESHPSKDLNVGFNITALKQGVIQML